MRKYLVILTSLVLVCASANAWWIFGAKESVPEALEPVPTPAEMLRNRVGEWMGDNLLGAPSRTVRAIVLPGGDLGRAGGAWGVAVNCIPSGADRVFVLFSSESERAGADRRVVIPDLETLVTPVGDVKIDLTVRGELFRNSRLFVPGTMNDAGLERLSQLAGAFLVKLRTYRIVPMFLGEGTGAAELAEAFKPYFAGRGTVFVCILPDSLAPSRLEGVSLHLGDNGMPAVANLAALLADGIGLQPMEVSLCGAKRLPPGDERLLANAVILQELPKVFDAKFAEKLPDFITPQEGKMLLDFAYAVLESQLLKTKAPDMPLFSKNFIKPYGCMVELKKDGVSLGQFASMPNVKPLVNLLVVNTVKFCREDAKVKLTKEDLPFLTLDVSVLSLPVPVSFKSLSELYALMVPDVDGVLVEIDGKTVGFMPVVWKQVKTADVFIQALCRRLGKKPADLLRKGSKVNIFKAAVFSRP